MSRKRAWLCSDLHMSAGKLSPMAFLGIDLNHTGLSRLQSSPVVLRIFQTELICSNARADEPRDSKPDMPQPQRIADHADRGERHGGGGYDRRQQDAERRVK